MTWYRFYNHDKVLAALVEAVISWLLTFHYLDNNSNNLSPSTNSTSNFLANFLAGPVKLLVITTITESASGSC